MSGYVWIGHDNQLYLQRCPKCSRENWAPAVATGRCAWCGYSATTDDVKKKEAKG